MFGSEDFGKQIDEIHEWERKKSVQALVISFEFRYPIRVLAKSGSITKQDADRICSGIRKIVSKKISAIKYEAFTRRAKVLRRKKRLEREQE